MKTISVIITAYNIEKYIKQCVESVINSTYKNLEIIIVEDCSTDKTKEYIQELIEKYPQIKLIQNEENKGAGYSRYIGITNSTGDYIITIDGDDYIKEDFLQSLMDMAQETKADIVSGGITIYNEKSGEYKTEFFEKGEAEGIEKFTKYWGNRIMWLNNKLIKAYLYGLVPYCKRRYIEDTPVIIPQLWYANKIAYTENCGYVYRMLDTSLTHNSNPIKDIVFKGLCFLDLIDFFEKKEEDIIQTIHLDEYIKHIISVLNNLIIEEEHIKDFKKEYYEFARRLLNRIAIFNVKFKTKDVKQDINNINNNT